MPEAQRIINIVKFINHAQQITFLPSKHRILCPALQYLAQKFTPGCNYTEREATELLSSWLCGPDPDVTRRMLIDQSLLARTPDCSRYWRHTFTENWVIR